MKEIWNDLPMQRFRQAMIDKKYISFNKNCQGCDSLWEKRIFDLPAGIRGISAITINNIAGFNLLGFFKRIAKSANSDFSIEIVKK